jgi:hypothetical protein
LETASRACQAGGLTPPRLNPRDTEAAVLTEC